jgi:hypothetical protein
LHFLRAESTSTVIWPVILEILRSNGVAVQKSVEKFLPVTNAAIELNERRFPASSTAAAERGKRGSKIPSLFLLCEDIGIIEDSLR